jgi:hypothetical protein
MRRVVNIPSTGPPKFDDKIRRKLISAANSQPDKLELCQEKYNDQYF